MQKSSESLTFLEWLNLNIDSITWEGRNKDQFYTLWEGVLCSENPFLSLDSVIKLLSSSPLKKWFTWLQEMNINYCFYIKNYSLSELSQKSHKSFNEINIILRSHFLKFYPLEVAIADKIFSSGNKLYSDNNLLFNQSDISSYTKLSEVYHFDDVMKEIEATLMDGWSDVLEFANSKVPQTFKRPTLNLVFNSRFIREVVLLGIIGIFIIFATRFGNKLYEESILSKVSILKTDFLWLDKQIAYKKETPVDEVITLDSKELEDLEKTETEMTQSVEVSPSTFIGESDVVLTSIKSLPKDFNSASLEQSKYEEIKEGGYRDHRYGRGRAYRILINSYDAIKTKKQIQRYIDKFKLSQVDNVAPGTTIPGGFYYNLYVSSNTLKDFMSELDEELEVTVYESRTAFSAPKDMNKIFIWIKLI